MSDTDQNKDAYSKARKDVAIKANTLREAMFGGEAGSSLDISFDSVNSKESMLAIAKNVPNTCFDGLNVGESETDMTPGAQIAAFWASQYAAHTKRHGEEPSDDILANAFDSLQFYAKGYEDSTAFDSASLQNTQGILHRQHMAAIVFPAMLEAVTSSMVTTIPGGHNTADLYFVERVLTRESFDGKTKAGTIIEPGFDGSIGTSDFIAPATEEADGTKKEFTWDIGKPLKNVMQFYVGKEMVARFVPETGSVVAFGSKMSEFGSFELTNQAEGKLKLVLKNAPGARVPVDARLEVNFEENTQLIPLINHKISKQTVHSHEDALASSQTIMANFDASREHGFNLRQLNVAASRNQLAADKDRSRLRLMRWASSGNYVMGIKPRSGVDRGDQLSLIAPLLANVGRDIMLGTKKTGLSGLVVSSGWTGLISQLIKEKLFVPVPGYRMRPEPHYWGKLLGQFDIVLDPTHKNKYEALAYGRGSNFSDAGMVASDAIPPVAYAHVVGENLKMKDTLYGRSFRDIHPFRGREYFKTITLDPTSSVVTGVQE